MLLQIPLIFTNSALVIVNSYFEDSKQLKLPNIVINSINLVIMSILRDMKILEKAEGIKQMADNFIELSHKLDAIKCADSITVEILNSYQDKYDIFIKGTNLENIPEHIKKNVKQTYNGKKFLPWIANGILADVV